MRKLIAYIRAYFTWTQREDSMDYHRIERNDYFDKEEMRMEMRKNIHNWR